MSAARRPTETFVRLQSCSVISEGFRGGEGNTAASRGSSCERRLAGVVSVVMSILYGMGVNRGNVAISGTENCRERESEREASDVRTVTQDLAWYVTRTSTRTVPSLPRRPFQTSFSACTVLHFSPAEDKARRGSMSKRGRTTNGLCILWIPEQSGRTPTVVSEYKAAHVDNDRKV